MNRSSRLIAAVFSAVLVVALAPMPTADADVAPVNRVSCPSATSINKFRPANSTEPTLTGVSQTAAYLCIYGFKSASYAGPGLEVAAASYTLTPRDLERMYELQRQGLVSKVQPLPSLGSNAFSYADPQGFTAVNWQLSPGSAVYANLRFSWMIAAQVPIAKLFRPMMEVYTIPGERTMNGRQWRTTCEPYSSTQRCRTEIFATTIKKTPTGYATVNGWAFNSLTYRWSDRAIWANNPLGRTGNWTSTNGRKWRTECDTKTTGRGACRSYIWTTVIDREGGTYVQQHVWVFNNQVLFTY